MKLVYSLNLIILFTLSIKKSIFSAELTIDDIIAGNIPFNDDISGYVDNSENSGSGAETVLINFDTSADTTIVTQTTSKKNRIL